MGVLSSLLLPAIPAARGAAWRASCVNKLVQLGLSVGSFGSRHPGVSNFLFADGAVRSVSHELDAATYRQLGHRSDGKLLMGGPTRPGLD